MSEHCAVADCRLMINITNCIKILLINFILNKFRVIDY